MLGTFEIPGEPDEEDNLTWDEIRAAADRSRWRPPPGAKSPLELLREDRERELSDDEKMKLLHAVQFDVQIINEPSNYREDWYGDDGR